MANNHSNPPEKRIENEPQNEHGNFSNFFSLNELDRKLRNFISNKEGYFVELGANNGVDQSNTLHFEKTLGWRGVLVEPILHRYLECVQNRSSDNKIFCAACVPDDYRHEFVRLIYSNLMSVAPELDLDLNGAEDHAKIGLRFLPPHEKNVVFGALARTLTSILEEAGAPTDIDLLSLDVEGAELDVLKGTNLNRYHFRFIVIESRNIDRVESYLRRWDYVPIKTLSDHDYLFERRTI